jgi:tartrate-resistant acid phosphatase type 5
VLRPYAHWLRQPPPRTIRRLPRTILRLESLETRLTPTTTQFAVIGDYGLSTSAGEAKVATLVKGWNPDYIITVGDNNYPNGSAATIDANVGKYYHDYIGGYTGTYGAGSAVNRFFPTIGTHDWQTRSGTPALPTPYLNYFTLPGNERYYTFTQGPVQFFAIDSGDGSGGNSDGFDPDGFSKTSVQAQWLQSQLAASTAPWKIVYFHHPAFSSGVLGSNSIMQWPFQQWGATAVISGSDHDYERLNVGGLPYFVNGVGGESYVAFTGTPLAGSQVRYADNWGAMHVTASDTSIQFQFVSVTGTVIDTYTIQASNSPPTVTVAATDATAAEAGADPGTFTVTRTGSTTSALTVNLTVGGTATNGVDYASISSTVTIAAGASSATVQLTPVDDSLAEGTETATLTVGASGAYNIGAANTATVSIQDNDSSTSSTTLVAAGSTWKYLDNGTDQGTAWRSTTFNDSAWKSGAAQLGYGDGDEATVVGYGPNAGVKYITTYFRTSFNVADASAVTALALKLIRDDGAVVYLNGVEVYRDNMGTGAVAYNTLAPLSLGGTDETTWLQAALSPTNLINGTNVLAVEMHQASPDSSDISFDLQLDAAVNTVVVTTPPPSTPRLTAASDNGLDNDDNYTSITTPTFVGTAPVGSTVKLFSDGTLVGTAATTTDGSYTITSATLANGTHAITATATDSSGSTSAASAALSLVIDTLAPTARIVAVTPDPRSTPVASITVAFNEMVTGLDLADLSLSFNGGPNLLTASQMLVTGDGGVTWTVGNLDGLTGAVGSYTLALTAAGSGITDQAGNVLTSGASDTWQVTATSIIDDGAAGFTTAGSWKVTNGPGYQGDYHYQDKGNGSRTATWTFTGLTPGLYRVSATWVAAGNLATNAPFTVLSGSTVLGTFAANQRVAPNDFTDAGVGWENLGGPYQVNGTTLTIRLTDKANGRVIADAVRIERLSPELAADLTPPAKAPALLTQSELDAITTAAMARWQAVEGPGVVLPAVKVTVADLPPGYLGAEGPSGVVIDRDAAGQGWFVDSTPLDDREFTMIGPDGELLATSASPAAGRYDLLTVVMHELGHAYGLTEDDDDTPPGTLMTESLPPGTRREIDAAIAQDVAALNSLAPFAPTASRADSPTAGRINSKPSAARSVFSPLDTDAALAALALGDLESDVARGAGLALNRRHRL